MPAPGLQAAAWKRRCLRRRDAPPSLPTFCCRTLKGPSGGWSKLAFDLGDGVAVFGRYCAKSEGSRALSAMADAKNKTPGVLFGSAGSLRERWCEAGDHRVSLQGPMLNSSSGNRVQASRFSGQLAGVAYSERPIKHWGIRSGPNATGRDSARCLEWEPIGGRYRPGTLHEVQGQFSRPRAAASKRLFAAMPELRSHHLFRRRRDRSQRPGRASGCEAAAPRPSRGR